MFASIGNFIKKGNFQAIIFIIVFMIVGYVVSIFLPSGGLLYTICRSALLTISLFIVWYLRSGWVWLTLAIISLVLFVLP